MSAEHVWSLLHDEYLPFRWFADHRQGTSIEALAQRTGLPAAWIEERIEAARICIEAGTRLPQPFPRAA